MKIQFYWLCFFCVAVESKLKIMDLTEKSFFVCNYFNTNFEFNCALLDNNILHKNYFDHDVSNYTCKVYKNHFLVNQSYTSAFSITLRNCRMPTLPPAFLQRLERVEQIILDATGIKSIDEKPFPDGCSWEKLSMSRNDLIELPPSLFSKTPNMSEIDFSRNRINNIDPNAFQGTTKKLQIIRLSYNRIETLDNSLFADLVGLRELYLDYNFIEYIPFDLSKSKDLTTLKLANNKIVRLDCNIFDLTTNKISIDVNFNHIREIDLNCDVHLESLELYANHNQLTSLTFPKSNLLDGLTTIDASRNLLENVTFQPIFRELTDLYLNDNNLKELFEWKDTLFPKLRILDFSNNLFNCSYLSVFLNNIPTSVQIKTSEYHSEIRKKIHGINCIDADTDDFQSGHSDEVDVERIIMWCLLTFLCLVATSLFVKNFSNKFRRNRLTETENLSIYLHN